MHSVTGERFDATAYVSRVSGLAIHIPSDYNYCTEVTEGAGFAINTAIRM